MPDHASSEVIESPQKEKSSSDKAGVESKTAESEVSVEPDKVGEKELVVKENVSPVRPKRAPKYCEFDLKKKLGMVITTSGLVGSVHEQGQAQAAGIVVGCKILQVGDVAVSNLDEIRVAMKSHQKTGKNIIKIKYKPASSSMAGTAKAMQAVKAVKMARTLKGNPFSLPKKPKNAEISPIATESANTTSPVAAEISNTTSPVTTESANTNNTESTNTAPLKNTESTNATSPPVTETAPEAEIPCASTQNANKPKKPKKVPTMRRPEAAQWSQTDAIIAAADESKGGWHEAALDGISAFLEQRAEADMKDASTMNESGRFADAAAVFTRILGEFETSKNPTDPCVARAQLGLATSLDGQGNFPTALEMNKKAVESFILAYGEEHADTADAWNNTGVTLYKMGRYEEAKHFLEKALTAYTLNYTEEHPMVARTLKNIGNVFKKEGRHEESLAAYSQALHIYEKTMGEHSSARAMTLNNMASVLKKLSKFDESVEHYKLAVHCYDQCKRDVKKESTNVLKKNHKLGKQALEDFKLKQQSMMNLLEGDEARARHNLGNVLYEFGRFEDAIVEFNHALTTKAKLYGSDNLDTQRTRKLLRATEKKLEQAIKRREKEAIRAKERADARAAKKMAINASEVATNAAKAAILSVEQSETVASSSVRHISPTASPTAASERSP